MRARAFKAMVAAAAVALVATLFVSATPAGAQLIHVVTNENDSGPGSFRDALDDAECGGGIIIFAPGVATIELVDGLSFDCSDTNLTIRAPGVTIKPAAGWTGATEDDFLDFVGSGRITIEGLTIMGDGTSGEDGIDLDATGDTTLALYNVTITDMAEDGIDIDDEGVGGDVLAADAEDGAEADDDVGSDGAEQNVGASAFGAAGVTLRLTDTDILRSGPSDDDDNGIDFDICDGDAVLDLLRSSVADSGGEGINIDQNCSGGVTASLVYSSVTGNGDEGLEIDEYEDGDVTVTVTATTISGNGFDDADEEEGDGDEGAEIDENDSGNLTFTSNGSSFDNNTEDGVDTDEDGSGNSSVTANDSSFVGNGEDGLELDSDSGLLRVVIRDSTLSNNGNGTSSSDEGLEVDGSSVAIVTVRNSALTGNSAGNGIDIDVDGFGFGYSIGTDLSGNTAGPVNSNVPFFQLP